MNDPTLIGPCADYEHDLVELHDGDLPLERASVVRLHVAQCPRCSAWVQAFASIDARLAAELPRPELASDFEARLQERLAALSRPAARGDQLGTLDLEREHDALLEALRRGARRSALLGAIGWATAMACIFIAARDLFREASGVLATVPGGTESWMVFSVVGVAVAVAGLAWSAVRDRLPLPGLAR
jgi:anti-sigma factor RsiW